MRPKLFIAAAGLSLFLALPISLAFRSRDAKIQSLQKINRMLQLKAVTPLAIKPVALIKPLSLAIVPQPVTAAAPIPVAPASYPGSHEDWMAEAGIPASDFPAVEYIVSHESGWNPNATEPTSGAHGLPQALPYAKTGCGWVDPICQLRWANSYAVSSYGSWWAAQAYWQLHRNW